jgi:hypothetical protein
VLASVLLCWQQWGSGQRAVTGGVRRDTGTKARGNCSRLVSIYSCKRHIAAASFELWTVARCENTRVCTAWHIVGQCEVCVKVSGVQWRHCCGEPLLGITKTETEHWRFWSIVIVCGAASKDSWWKITSWLRIHTSWREIHTPSSLNSHSDSHSLCLPLPSSLYSHSAATHSAVTTRLCLFAVLQKVI